MLAHFSSYYKLSTIRVQQNVGIAKGRNLGILKAIGELIIFHDSDMIAPKDFVRKHIEAHEGQDSTIVCGSCWKRIYSLYYRDFKLEPHHIQQFQHRYPLIRTEDKE